ncbi:hypothetical protein [Leptolyngbya sp. PCC 6406]|uniref:hypothetical protein n=1 Tax=Leptolyngbya sp. PCC 6406 TaxID=1173264 RepID=UPI0002AC804A|nr:hypothetical protein [Leptolyngbya sp. PCC 6406]
MAMNPALETQAFTILAVLAAGLMVLVTVGVLYLTVAEWRDRRRRDNERTPAPSSRRRK